MADHDRGGAPAAGPGAAWPEPGGIDQLWQAAEFQVRLPDGSLAEVSVLAGAPAIWDRLTPAQRMGYEGVRSGPIILATRLRL